MKVAIYSVIKDVFIPTPTAVWAKAGDELIVSDATERIFIGWARDSVVLKSRTDQNIKQNLIHIMAKDIASNQISEREYHPVIEEVEQPIKEKADNRSMTTRKKKVRTK